MTVVRLFPVVLSLLISLSAFAEIRETNDIAVVFAEIEEGTLVAWDIDSTIFAAVDDWGSDPWYDHLVEFLSHHHPKAVAVAIALKVWSQAQYTTEVRPVEPDTPDRIRRAQAKGTPMIGLTSRPEDINDRTLDQLASVGVDFSANGGTLLAIGPTASKGQTLVDYVPRAPIRPRKIIFVDDKTHYAESVATALEALGIPFIVFRYGAADARAEDYRRRITDRDLCVGALAIPTA